MDDMERIHSDGVNQTYTDNSGHVADKVASFITLYIEAISLFGGLIGNALVFVVFGKTDYYNKSIHVYIRSLSAFDFTILSGPMMIHWLNYNFFPERKNLTMCVLFLTISRFCVDCNAWVIAAMAANQYVAILHPHRFKTLCSVRQSRINIFLIAILAIVKNGYTLRTAGFAEHRDGTKLCVVVPDAGNTASIVYQWIDVAVSSVVPFLCMTYFNVRVVLRLSSKKKKYAARVRQLSTILLVVSVLFIVSSLCKKISAMVLTYRFRQADSNRSYLILTISAARAVWCTVNAANMWVYLGLCSHFRDDVRRVVCPGWKAPEVEPSSSGRRNITLS